VEARGHWTLRTRLSLSGTFSGNGDKLLAEDTR